MNCVCGNCKYSKYSTTEKEFYCSNTDGENYGVPTMYDDCCDDFEEREQAVWNGTEFQTDFHQ